MCSVFLGIMYELQFFDSLLFLDVIIMEKKVIKKFSNETEKET